MERERFQDYTNNGEKVFGRFSYSILFLNCRCKSLLFAQAV